MRTVLIFFISIVGLNLKAQHDNNFQYWFITYVRVHLMSDFQISFQQRCDFSFDKFQAKTIFSEASIAYDVTNWLNLAFGYKQLYFRDEAGGYYSENRPQLAGTLSAAYSDFSFSLRNRLDYRHFTVKKTYFSYNNKSTIRYTKYPVQPFLSEEFFYNIENPKIEMLRINSGLYIHQNFWRIEIYFGHQISSGGEIKKIYNAFGNTVALEF